MCFLKNMISFICRQIQLYFNKFQLQVPNDCESNFVDVFGSRTDIPSRLHNFCGSIAESVLSPSNVLQLRFLAEPRAIASDFEALFTAFKEKPKGGSKCFFFFWTRTRNRFSVSFIWNQLISHFVLLGFP